MLKEDWNTKKNDLMAKKIIFILMTLFIESEKNLE
jgi:hypothetical protein